MALRRQPREAAKREGPSTKPGTAEGAALRRRDPDHLGEAKRAAKTILAAWALQELIALRNSKGAHG